MCSQERVSDFIGIMKALSDTLKGGGSIPAHAGTALLYGPPGTGKTEFAEHLGAMIGRETQVVTGADLLRSRSGKTERLIQDLFVDAKAKGRLLVIDEVDYLMRNRENARKGCEWESSMVDQFLAVMGAYEGLFIATTNNSKIIDAAVKRRFSHSFAFTYARGDQLELLWDKYLADCSESAIANEEKERLLSLERLTPGEFLNVRNGHDPQFGGKKAPAAKLLMELEELSRFRDGKKKRKEGAHRRIGMI
ncbi:MAG: ATP-binding protein [Succinivibrio sp.]|nr:ATP-binding protein [Succinivibrio sp.]